MRYVLLMTIAGSGLLLGVLLWEKLMDKHVTESFRYWSLVIVMLTYLVPWVWLKGAYGNVSFEVKNQEPAVMDGQVVFGDSVIRREEELTVTNDYRVRLILVGSWIGIGLMISLVRFVYYIYKRRQMIKHIIPCEDEAVMELLEDLKKELHIGRRVRVYRIENQKFSLSMGAVNPVIFLQEDYGKEELEFILRHELIHIARGDLLVKLVMSLVCCLHWFNPFAYLLNNRLSEASERACDEKAIRGRTNDEKALYAHLIVRSANSSRSNSRDKLLFYGNYLATNKKQVEERIRVIMNKRERKTWGKVIVASVFAVLLFVDSLSAMAYPDVYSVNVKTEDVAVDSVEGAGLVTLPVDNHQIDNPILYDEQIVTADGDVFAAQTGDRPQLFCIHQWMDVEYQTHVRNDSGGCVIKGYECQYCPKCKTANVGDLLYTTIYVTCTHDY